MFFIDLFNFQKKVQINNNNLISTEKVFFDESRELSLI